MSDQPTTEAPRPIAEIIRSAMDFWERRRVLFNIALLAIVIAQFVIQLPESRQSLEFPLFLGLFIAAVIANALYCFAYAADIPIQLAGFGRSGAPWRWPIWLIGTLFAMSVAYFMLLDMFAPDIYY